MGEGGKFMLDALERLLLTRSLSAVTVADVCREAGVPRATFYRHYANLDAMRIGLFWECVNELRAAGMPWLSGESVRLAPMKTTKASVSWKGKSESRITNKATVNTNREMVSLLGKFM